MNNLVFSQNTYPKVTKDSLVVITPFQLRQTNLIFLEHSTLKLEIKELNKQVVDYESIAKCYQGIEENRKLQVDSLMKGYQSSQLIIHDKNLLIDKQDKKLKKRRAVAIGGMTVSIALLTILLLQR